MRQTCYMILLKLCRLFCAKKLVVPEPIVPEPIVPEPIVPEPITELVTEPEPEPVTELVTEPEPVITYYEL